MFVDVSGGGLIGIDAYGRGTQVHGNQVSGFDTTATQGGVVNTIAGVVLLAPYQRASGNQLIGMSGGPSGFGIYAADNSSFCVDNTVGGFPQNIMFTCTGTGNETRP